MPIPDDLRPTPFSPRYENTIEEWIDVYGHAVPLAFGDPGTEYAAIRGAAGISEYSMLYKWFVEGPDAVHVVDAVFSREVTDQPVGRIAYGVVTDTDGLMVDDVTVSVLSADTVLVVGGNPMTQALLTDKARATGGPTTVTERRDETAVLTLQGPRSRQVLARLTGADVSDDAFPYYTFRTDLVVAGAPAQVNRVGFTAELGYEIVVPRDHALTLWDAALEAGADLSVVPFGAAALMMCRIEAGMIMGELEYDRTVTPYECRMGWSLDFDKGPWLGQDALRAKKGTVRGRVVTVQIDAEPDAVEGARLLLSDTGDDTDGGTDGGTDVGHVTMAVPSPHLGGATLAMARVDQDAAKPGTTLTVAGDDGPIGSATVVTTPVYDPQRTRVRS